MIRKLARSIREYKLPSILTFVFILCEAVIECLIPFITAALVNSIKELKCPRCSKRAVCL